jgi:hypothetical protein
MSNPPVIQRDVAKRCGPQPTSPQIRTSIAEPGLFPLFLSSKLLITVGETSHVDTFALTGTYFLVTFAGIAAARLVQVYPLAAAFPVTSGNQGLLMANLLLEKRAT